MFARITYLGLMATAWLALAPQSFAQDTAPDPEKLESLTKAEDEARAKEAELGKRRKAVIAEISQLKKSLQKSAQQTRAYEREAAALQTDLETMSAEIEALEGKLATDKFGVTQLLAALQRLEATPPPAMVSTPEDAVKAAQAAQLMSNLSENLRIRANELAISLQDLSQARTEVARQSTALAANRKKLDKRYRSAQTLVTKKAKLQESIAADEAMARKEVEKLAAESKTLRDLISNFESEIGGIGPRVKPGKGSGKRKRLAVKPLKLPKGTNPFAKAKGTLMRPITGKLLRGFGKGEKGLTYAGQARGQVLAPYAGRVEFAGPFKNYDQVVILNVGSG